MIQALNSLLMPGNRDGINEIRRSIRNKRFDLWKDFLTHLERTAEPDHSVVRFPNSSSYIFSTGKDCFWMIDPAFGYSDVSEK